MKFTEWLDAEKGRTKAVAERFCVSPGAITQWRVAVPRDRMRELHALTEGQVDYSDMLPSDAQSDDPEAYADKGPVTAHPPTQADSDATLADAAQPVLILENKKRGA